MPNGSTYTYLPHSCTRANKKPKVHVYIHTLPHPQRLHIVPYTLYLLHFTLTLWYTYTGNTWHACGILHCTSNPHAHAKNSSTENPLVFSSLISRKSLDRITTLWSITSIGACFTWTFSFSQHTSWLDHIPINSSTLAKSFSFQNFGCKCFFFLCWCEWWWVFCTLEFLKFYVIIFQFLKFYWFPY